ncbi:MFS transporter [Streptomyces sp. KL116D]|uniref:MFS transporter n=1 Tax=Streptomyces sp. KL116D TaxID=3045152 RepID=UPI003557864D
MRLLHQRGPYDTTSRPTHRIRAHDPWRYRWIVLGIATFTQAASGFFVGGLGALGVHLQSALDLTTAQLGLLISAAQLVPLAGLLVAGELLDRYSERWVVGVGASIVALALGAGAWLRDTRPCWSRLLLVGAGYSTVQPGGSKSVASWFDGSQRGLAMGIRQAGLPLGAALASAVLPLVAEGFGWRATLLTGGFVALLGAALFAGLLPPPARRVRSTGQGPSDPLAAQLGARLRMLREPSTVKIMLSGTSLISVQYGVAVLAVLHLHQTSSVGAGQAALVLVASQGAGVAGRICLAALSDRSGSGRYAIVLVCMVAAIAGLVVLMTPAGRAPVVASAVFVWLGFFGFGWYGPWVAYVTEALHRARPASPWAWPCPSTRSPSSPCRPRSACWSTSPAASPRPGRCFPC